MKIRKRSITKYYKIDELEKGDVFYLKEDKDRNILYMKTELAKDEEGNEENCVELTTGEYAYVHEWQRCIKLDCELLIKEEV